MKKTIKDIPYETCTVCGGYKPVGKFGSEGRAICVHCLNGGKLANMKPIVKEKTPGRNDPCDCGSGLKYKKCHGK